MEFVRDFGDCCCNDHSILEESKLAWVFLKAQREEELTSETRKMVDARANRIGMTSCAGGYVSSSSLSTAAAPASGAGDSAIFSESFGTLFDVERVSRLSSILSWSSPWNLGL